MKLTIALATAAALVMGIANAQTVTTENAAGYAKVTIAAPGLELLANPFDTFDGEDPNLATLLGENWPQGAAMFIWDPVSMTYSASNFGFNSTFTGLEWKPERTVKRGQGFFLELPEPAAGAARSYDWYAHGQVPYAGTGATTTSIDLQPGLNMTSLAYPVSRQITSPDIGLTQPLVEQGDAVFAWDDTAKSYVVENFGFNSTFTALEWKPGNMALIPGKGVFFQSNSAKTWTQEKGNFYNWP